jgi:hypothetical protein
MSDKYFLELEKTNRTDFLYFISSSYFWRFGNTEEFKMHFDFDIEAIKKDPYQFIHRNLLKQIQRKLPPNSDLKLYPFSLKKGSNIHGIIFGAKHIRAVDKFLDVAWEHNKINGDANFDIDNDKVKAQLDLFGTKPLTKIEEFHLALEEKIKTEKETTNETLFLFALEKGHPKHHANDYVKELKKQKKVDYTGLSPKINYDTIYKEKKTITIKWLNHR